MQYAEATRKCPRHLCERKTLMQQMQSCQMQSNILVAQLEPSLRTQSSQLFHGVPAFILVPIHVRDSRDQIRCIEPYQCRDRW